PVCPGIPYGRGRRVRWRGKAKRSRRSADRSKIPAATAGNRGPRTQGPPRDNGDKTVTEIHEHLAHDTLVGWAWAPGGNREPAPGTQAQFGALITAWIETGAARPTRWCLGRPPP